MAQVEAALESVNWKIDVVLSHTCPYNYMPREAFFSWIDQSMVDNSTERWLDSIEKKLDYSEWYCGHFHTDKRDNKIIFMFEGFREL